MYRNVGAIGSSYLSRLEIRCERERAFKENENDEKARQKPDIQSTWSGVHKDPTTKNIQCDAITRSAGAKIIKVILKPRWIRLSRKSAPLSSLLKNLHDIIIVVTKVHT